MVGLYVHQILFSQMDILPGAINKIDQDNIKWPLRDKIIHLEQGCTSELIFKISQIQNESESHAVPYLILLA